MALPRRAEARKDRKLKRAAAAELASYFIKNSIDCLIIGEPFSGKTAIASAVCPNAAVIHGSELKTEFLSVLRQVFSASNHIIIENITDEGAKFIEPMLSSRTIIGSRFECAFIITARKNCGFAFLPVIEIDPLDAEKEIAWAKERGIHPAIALLMSEDSGFCRRHNAAKIAELSKALRARPAAKTLPPLIKAFLGADEGAKDFLISAISAPIESINDAAVSTSENALSYETAFVESLKNNPKKGDAERFADYAAALSKSDPPSAFRMLFALLESQKGSEALNAALARNEVREMIDAAIPQ